jgi:hypothetical protein
MADDLMPAEGSPMKLKSLSILAVLALGCTAAFGQTTVKLGFLSHDQKTQYCDYEKLAIEKTTLVTGVHFVSTPGSTTCSEAAGDISGALIGVISDIPANSGLPVTGTVVTFADDTLAVQAVGGCGCAEYYVSILRPSTKEELENGVFGWVLYVNGLGTPALGNFGFTTKELGNDNANSLHTFDVF